MPATKTSGVARAEAHLVEHCDTPQCAVCLVTVVSVSHITSLIRQLRDRGWVISTTRAGCEVCDKTTHHYQVVGTAPSTQRAILPVGLRRRYLAQCNNLDAFTGMPSEKLELDHRVPHSEADGDEDPVDDETIADRYQPLTAANNQLKRWACQRCQTTGQRPAFMCIDFWIEGSADRPETCQQCPWANPALWRTAVQSRLSN
jgi:hypothetical protein